MKACKVCGDSTVFGPHGFCPTCWGAAKMGFRWGAGVAAALGFLAGAIGWLAR